MSASGPCTGADPCPFCGSRDIWFEVNDAHASLYCQTCHTWSGRHADLTLAVLVWNRRLPPAPLKDSAMPEKQPPPADDDRAAAFRDSDPDEPRVLRAGSTFDPRHSFVLPAWVNRAGQLQPKLHLREERHYRVHYGDRVQEFLEPDSAARFLAALTNRKGAWIEVTTGLWPTDE